MYAQSTTSRQIKRLLILGFSFLILACASKVPLTEPALVEDRTGQIIVAPTLPNVGSSTPTLNPDANLTSRAVKALDLSPMQQSSSGQVLYFDFDSYSIKSEFQPIIESEAKRLNANRGHKTNLAGHTDEVGGREYNLALGQKRAEAVKRALSILGVQEAQLEAVSYGKEKPASTGSDESSAAKNRRVEFNSR